MPCGTLVVKVLPIKLDGEGNVIQHESMFALQARGKSGPGAGLGFARFGHSKYGADNQSGGIYQKRVTGYNQTGRITGRPRKTYFVKMRNYRPTNPQTPLQQAHRAKMAAAVAAWTALTDVEKSSYNERGKRANKVGRNLFISEYIKSH